jgi:Transposase DDE domain
LITAWNGSRFRCVLVGFFYSPWTSPVPKMSRFRLHQPNPLLERSTALWSPRTCRSPVQRLERKASKKQMTTRPGTLEFAMYVIVFTTRSSGSTADVLRFYRMRWQIELVFKRLKSLAQLGHVPKHNDRSFARLALWKIAYHAPGTKIDPHWARYFPLGLPTLGVRDHVVRRVNSVSRFTRSRKLSNRTSPYCKRFIRGMKLHMPWRKSRATDHFNWHNSVPREHRFKTD